MLQVTSESCLTFSRPTCASTAVLRTAVSGRTQLRLPSCILFVFLSAQSFAATFASASRSGTFSENFAHAVSSEFFNEPNVVHRRPFEHFVDLVVVAPCHREFRPSRHLENFVHHRAPVMEEVHETEREKFHPRHFFVILQQESQAQQSLNDVSDRLLIPRRPSEEKLETQSIMRVARVMELERIQVNVFSFNSVLGRLGPRSRSFRRAPKYDQYFLWHQSIVIHSMKKCWYFSNIDFFSIKLLKHKRAICTLQ